MSFQKLFTKESLSHAISGSLSSVIALGLVYPLDQVRILKQVEGGGKRGPFAAEDKYRMFMALAPVLALLESRGVAGAYKGFKVQQIALGLSNFIYFYIRNMGTAVVISARGGRSLNPTQEFAVTTIAGAVNAIAAAPLWNVCDKIKTDNKGRYKGIVDCVRQLVVRCCDSIHHLRDRVCYLVVGSCTGNRCAPLWHVSFDCGDCILL